jgi:hypothetical protein
MVPVGPDAGQYAGSPAGTDCWIALGMGWSCVGSSPALKSTSAVVAPLPSVSPRPSRVQTLPRSTVTEPVHWVEHQVVEALPSIALDAGEPAASVEAVAVPSSAMSSEVCDGLCSSAEAVAARLRPAGLGACPLPGSASSQSAAAL